MTKKICETCEYVKIEHKNSQSPCKNCFVCDKWEKVRQRDFEGINGVADEEIVTNEANGKQSRLDYRFDLIDTKAIFRLANVLHTGEQRYGKDNWRKIDTDSHLNHATSHIYAYLAGDKQDDHLSHAFCRLMMALGVEV